MWRSGDKEEDAQKHCILRFCVAMRALSRRAAPVDVLRNQLTYFFVLSVTSRQKISEKKSSKKSTKCALCSSGIASDRRQSESALVKAGLSTSVVSTSIYSGGLADAVSWRPRLRPRLIAGVAKRPRPRPVAAIGEAKRPRLELSPRPRPRPRPLSSRKLIRNGTRCRRLVIGAIGAVVV